jgi:aspartyl-tRNA synthetase
MGRIRADCVKLMEELRESKCGDNKLSFVWIVDFPLFLPKDDSEELESSHHPFTAPKSTDIDILFTDPNKVLGQHFDLVLNGQEVGGGSIRIHDHKMQEYILKNILKEDVDSMEYFLDALRSGCPPHGGIALGLDRLLSIMCKTGSIRDVMAFPKSAHGKDLMAGSPTAIPDSVKKLYHIFNKQMSS